MEINNKEVLEGFKEVYEKIDNSSNKLEPIEVLYEYNEGALNKFSENKEPIIALGDSKETWPKRSYTLEEIKQYAIEENDQTCIEYLNYNEAKKVIYEIEHNKDNKYEKEKGYYLYKGKHEKYGHIQEGDIDIFLYYTDVDEDVCFYKPVLSSVYVFDHEDVVKYDLIEHYHVINQIDNIKHKTWELFF